MELEEFLYLVLKKLAADRTPYVPVRYFKAIPNHGDFIKTSHRLGLLFWYKKGEAIGLTDDGKKLALGYAKKISEQTRG